MTFPVSVAPSVDTSGSALRYGLLDIKPMEVIDIIKRCGLKFRRVTRTFETVSPSKTFAELVTQENEAIFSIIEIPKWFDPEELARVFSQRNIERYESDPELKEAVETLRKSERKGRPLFSFVQFMKQRFESRRDEYLEVEAERFLSSNFPLSFYNKFVVFDNTYYDFIKVLENIVRKYEFLASASYTRSFLAYQKKIEEMKRKIRPILDRVDACFFSYMCLKKYVMVWNSRDYEEVLNPKFLDIKNMDTSEFEGLRASYNTELRATRQFLLRSNPEILQKAIDSTSYTKKMFANIVMLPSNYLHLES